MFVKNAEGLKDISHEPLTHHNIDKNGNPIFRGDGRGIDYSKVKPIDQDS